MNAVPRPSKANLAQGSKDASAVSAEMVSLTKAQHIELVMQAKYWKSLHARAVQREQWRHERFGRIVHQLKEQAGKREAELLSELALMLYHLNNSRLQAHEGGTERASRHDELQRALQAMVTRRDAEMGQIGLSEPALKVLTSMKNHWDGLTVFVHHPWVPMDNNAAHADNGMNLVMPAPGLCRFVG